MRLGVIRVFFAGLISFVTLCVWASQTVRVNAFGEGGTHDEAVQSALREALRQVNGSVIRTDVTMTTAQRQTVSVGGGGESAFEEIVDHSSGQGREVLKGVISSYRVLEKKVMPTGRIEITAEVDVLKYENPLGNGRKPKIAVFPFRASVPEYGVGGDVRDGGRIARDVCQRIEKVMSQSGQFSMLSRDSEDAMVSEERFIAQKAPLSETVKIGQRMGADFIIVGEVRDCVVSAPVSTMSKFGKKRVKIDEATLRLNCRMLVVSTCQIVWVDDLTVKLSDKELLDLKGRAKDAYEKLLEMAASKILESADVFMLQQDK